MEFHELALFMIPLLLATAVGCLLLRFQCQKLGRVLAKKNVQGQAPQQQHRQPTGGSNHGKVQNMKGLRSQMQSSTRKHHAELVEEIRSVTQMQMELTAQLGDLQTYLAQMKNKTHVSWGDDGTDLLAADEITKKKD